MVTKIADTITERFIETIDKRLKENNPVRRSLPIWGRLHIDRQLPFLCVYRRRTKLGIQQAERLIMGEASYLTASGNRQLRNGLSLLVRRIVKTLSKSFGSFLIVEIWETPEKMMDGAESEYVPGFRIHCQKNFEQSSTVTVLAQSLKSIEIRGEPAFVETKRVVKTSPPGLSAFLTPSEAADLGCRIIGIEVNPIYGDQVNDLTFPLILRELHRGFARSLKRSFFQFTRSETTHHPKHYQSLGRWSVVKAVWDVDRMLAELSGNFDFLLQVTPINSHAAWTEFKKNSFERTPDFLYRPLPFDTNLAKRQLFKIPIERIEDPTLAQLFREQILELDRKFTMLMDLGTPRFLYGSMQLYGVVDDSLMNVALDILNRLPPRSRDDSNGGTINAEEFADRARKEVAYFRETLPQIQTKVTVRNDITELMVSHGNLLVGKDSKIAKRRVEALIQHEVGTHVLTYLNGRTQPFRQLCIGLSGYDELQEGLAVLAEYLVGGLTRPRLRLLAARVVAAVRMVQGATFVDVYRELTRDHKFGRNIGFNIAVRTFRGGGLIKDAIYLRGLVKLLKYLKQGGELDPLFIGKITAAHVMIIKELQWRKVLRDAPLKPRYLNNPVSIEKLRALRSGLEVLDLVKRRVK